MFKRTASNKRPASWTTVLTLALISTLPHTGAFAEPATVSNETGLQQLLEQQGWQTQSAPDGSLTLRPPARTTGQSGDTPDADTSQAAPASATAPEIEHLLLERGWRTETDASGNTLLLPAKIEADKNQISETVTTDNSDSPPAATADTAPFAQFKRALNAKGWRVESAPDGSLLVLPPVKTEPSRVRAQSERGYCEGEISLAVEQREVALPIDSPEKAARLTTDWIANFGGASHTVGRVRQINRVYAVSVVDRHPPYKLQNQLIIRRENGRIMALH